MAGEWTTLRLGGVCSKIGSGATPRGGSSVYLNEGDVALIRSQNVYNDGFRQAGLAYLTKQHAAELENVEVSEQDVLLNITGDSVARVCQVDPRFLPARVNQHVAIIRPDPAVLCPRYLRYYLVSPGMQAHMLSLAGAGATRNALTKGIIESFEVPAPVDVAEQRAIAHILGTLDDKIELNRRMNETLEGIARALFKSWFVDFDPVRAKAEGRDSGLPGEIADRFPDKFEESEVGDIPRGWRIGSVGDEFRVTMGQSPPGHTYNHSGEGLPFYQGRADFGFRFPNPRVYCAAPTRMAAPDDTLVSVRAPVGDVNRAEETCCIGRGVAGVRHRSGKQSYTYYTMRLLEPEFSRFEAEGTVFGSIGKTDFHAIRCLVPPPSAVAAFEAIVRPLDRRIYISERESRTLVGLRDSLLPKLVSGQIRVKDAERMVEEVA